MIIAHNKLLLRIGNYDYGFSHLPYHKLRIPNKLFTVTCLRDPVERVVSHYKMIKKYSEDDNIFREDYEIESNWLGKNVEDFVCNMPRQHRERKLYMFSKNFNVKHALKNLKDLDYVLFLSDFKNDLKKLSQNLNYKIPYFHKRKSSKKNQL